MHYGQLIGSVFAQFARYPLHRQRSLLGCLIFAMFSVLWTSLAFLLSSEVHSTLNMAQIRQPSSDR